MPLIEVQCYSELPAQPLYIDHLVIITQNRDKARMIDSLVRVFQDGSGGAVWSSASSTRSEETS